VFLFLEDRCWSPERIPLGDSRAARAHEFREPFCIPSRLIGGDEPATKLIPIRGAGKLHRLSVYRVTGQVARILR
jgi:hypothetical protein